MKKSIIISLILIAVSFVPHSVKAQLYGVKVNTLALFTGTINAGLELSVAKQYTLDFSLYYNPIALDNVQAKAFIIQPGVRYWLYESFVGHFFGANIAAGTYDVGNDRWHYKGQFAGLGVSYGHTWMLGNRWNLTVEAGVGVYYMEDRKRWYNIDPQTDLELRKHYRRVAIAPSKVEVAFSYLF